MTFDAIKNALSTLTAAQLRELHQRISVLRSLSGDGTADTTPGNSDAHLMCEEIVTVLSAQGFLCSLRHLRTDQSGYRAFIDKVPNVFQYVRMVTEHRNEQRALLRLGLRLVCDDLHWMKVPLTGRALMNNIEMIPASIDKRFPGYARR